MTKFIRSDHSVKWIPVKDISVVWLQAQRGFSEREAKRIGENFDPDSFGIVTVTLPNGDGIYHCIDGQHRVGGARIALGEDQCVPCKVINAADPKKAADIFDKMNSGRAKPTAVERFKVAVTAEREMETAINKMIVSLGYHVAFSSGDGAFRAVATACTIYKRHGIEVLRDAIILIRSTWGQSSEAVDGTILAGYAALLADFGFKVDGDRLVKKMQKAYTPGRLVAAAKAKQEFDRGSVADAVKALLLNAYNAGLRSGHLSKTVS